MFEIERNAPIRGRIAKMDLQQPFQCDVVLVLVQAGAGDFTTQ